MDALISNLAQYTSVHPSPSSKQSLVTSRRSKPDVPRRSGMHSLLHKCSPTHCSHGCTKQNPVNCPCFAYIAGLPHLVGSLQEPVGFCCTSAYVYGNSIRPVYFNYWSKSGTRIGVTKRPLLQFLFNMLYTQVYIVIARHPSISLVGYTGSILRSSSELSGEGHCDIRSAL